jgi:hypothetical protein
MNYDLVGKHWQEYVEQPSELMLTFLIQELVQELRSFAWGKVSFSLLLNTHLDVNLVGIAPEAEVTYPRINPT